MDEHAWSDPVYIALDDDLSVVAVCTTKRAAEYLVYAWPSADGDKRRAALLACLAVFTAGHPPELARQRFIAAAREAGLLLDGGKKNANLH